MDLSSGISKSSIILSHDASLQFLNDGNQVFAPSSE